MASHPKPTPQLSASQHNFLAAKAAIVPLEAMLRRDLLTWQHDQLDLLNLLPDGMTKDDIRSIVNKIKAAQKFYALIELR